MDRCFLDGRHPELRRPDLLVSVDPEAKRDIRRLKPASDAIPPLFVGGLLSLVMIIHHQYDYLYGIWMCHFGLANLAPCLVMLFPKKSPCSLFSISLAAQFVSCFKFRFKIHGPWASFSF